MITNTSQRKMEDGEIPTATPFSAVVREGEPFCLNQLAAQDVLSSLLITHVSYLPPTSLEELKKYYQTHPEVPKPIRVYEDATPRELQDSGNNNSTTSTKHKKKHTQETDTPHHHDVNNSNPRTSYLMTYAVAEIEDFSVGNELRRVTIGCFPLDFRRLPSSGSTSNVTPSSSATTATSRAITSSPSIPSGNKKSNKDSCIAVPHGMQLLVPVDTDVLRNLHVQLDCDGFVKLLMRGPGELFFYGEQRSLLLPEWKNHHFFRVGEDDEEIEEDSADMDVGELAEMFRLAR